MMDNIFLDIIDRILMVLFFMSLLNTVRHAYFFIQAFFISTEDAPTKYILREKSLIFLGVSIAYIITSLITGIKI
jgi:hypothetical protein